MRLLWGLTILLVAATASANAADMTDGVYFQAHRGGLAEAPENTLVAVRYAWTIAGAVPEVDVRTTKDGELVLLHDATLKRTTDAPEAIASTNIADLTLSQVESVDAGIRFDAKYAGEKVPLLKDVFADMTGRPERQIYLDVKQVELKRLVKLIRKYDLESQCIFVHGKPETCLELSKLYKRARTMTWLSGSVEQVKEKFAQLEQRNFQGLSQLQFHAQVLDTADGPRLALDAPFLRNAFEKTRAAGVELQLTPSKADPKILRELMDIGVRWFVTDEPKRFSEAVQAAGSLAP